MSGAQNTGVRCGAEIILNEVKNLDAVSQGLSNWLDSVPQGTFVIQSHFFSLLLLLWRKSLLATSQYIHSMAPSQGMTQSLYILSIMVYV